jgi:hypothetical protein
MSQDEWHEAMVEARMDIADAELRAFGELLKSTGPCPDPAKYVVHLVELVNLHELACLMPLMVLLAEPRLQQSEGKRPL